MLVRLSVFEFVMLSTEHVCSEKTQELKSWTIEQQELNLYMTDV